MYAIDVHQGLMAASDQHGNVALINHVGVMWKRKSPGEFGWMVGEKCVEFCDRHVV